MLRFISLYFRWVGLGVSNTIGLAVRLGFGSSVGILSEVCIGNILLLRLLRFIFLSKRNPMFFKKKHFVLFSCLQHLLLMKIYCVFLKNIKGNECLLKKRIFFYFLLYNLAYLTSYHFIIVWLFLAYITSNHSSESVELYFQFVLIHLFY